MLVPSIRMSPESSSISRLTSFIAVVFPAPDGPTRMQISPDGTVSERSSTAALSVPAYRLVARSKTISAAAVRLIGGAYVLVEVKLALLLMPLVFAGAGSPGAPVVVAVVDSGVSPSVPGLVTGYNAVDGSTDTAEAGGHG